MQNNQPHANYCGAKTRSGKPCRNRAMSNGRCRMHGGKSKRGAEHGQFKTGKYSKYMPKELLSVYGEMKDDPQLLSLRSEIALMDALLSSLLPKLDTGESGESWDKVKDLVKTARRGYKSESLATLEDALDTMEDLANQRILHYETHKEIKATVDTRRKLVEAETKITMQQDKAISVEQLMLFVTQVLGVIQEVVKDQKQQYAIAVKLQEFISLPAGDASPD